MPDLRRSSSAGCSRPLLVMLALSGACLPGLLPAARRRRAGLLRQALYAGPAGGGAALHAARPDDDRSSLRLPEGASSPAGPTARGRRPCTAHAPCFGYSFPLARSVTTLIVDRLPVTASIAIGAAVLWLLVGVRSACVAALNAASWSTGWPIGFALIGVSAPSFLVGLLAILVFGFWLNMVPVNGYVPLTESPVDWAWHLITPWCVLAILRRRCTSG